MPFNNSAQQYNEAFRPRRLGNWEGTQKDRGLLTSRIPASPVMSTTSSSFKGKSNTARTFPDIKSGSVTPTNKPSICIPSSCRKSKGNCPPQNPSPQQSSMDPFLIYLREIQLPVIWVIGPLTKSTRVKRKLVVKELASRLGFVYIHLDSEIDKWVNRQQRQQRTSSKSSIAQSQETETSTNVLPKFLPDEFSTILRRIRISFDTSTVFPTDKVLELMKFAMIESLPTKGFVIDGFPCNLEEAEGFETILYPVSLALHFPRNVHRQQEKPRTDDSSTPRDTGDTRPLTYDNERLPSNTRFRRKYQLTVTSEAELCGEKKYGTKMIRVFKADEMDDHSKNVLHQVVRKHLAKEADEIKEAGSSGQIQRGRGGGGGPNDNRTWTPSDNAENKEEADGESHSRRRQEKGQGEGI